MNEQSVLASPALLPFLQAEKLRRKRQAALEFTPYGAIAQLFKSQSHTKIVLAGPAGTGKSRGALEYVHHCCKQYPDIRTVMMRKTRASLTQTGIVTYEEKVLKAHADQTRVHFHGGDQQYNYPNGSILAVGGLDKASKIMSSEWDIIYIQEATELVQDEWEKLFTRNRNWKLPFQQLIGDVNPDAPTHWIKRLGELGSLTLLESRHEDNPELFDQRTKLITPRGINYLKLLDSLTGVRYQRLRLGKWVAAEGIVFENWDEAVHRVDRFDIPDNWTRYLSIDFGYTNPFVCQFWAQDPDGRLYRYREIYHTKRLVEDHARLIKSFLDNEPRPRAIICDHDAEDRATLEKYLGMATTAAPKNVSAGIQAVSLRMRKAGDGKARIFFLRDSLVERDQALVDSYKPCSTEEEIPAYVWDESASRKRGEQPVKDNDHGCDTTRYECYFLDGDENAVYSVYRGLLTEDIFYDDSSRPIALLSRGGYMERWISVITGTASPQIYLDLYDDGNTIWLEREFYWDPLRQGMHKTNGRYADDLVAGCEQVGWSGLGTQSRTWPGVILDPLAVNFKAELVNRGLYVIEAEPNIDDGIRRVMTMLSQKKLRIHRNCVNVRADLENYAWDSTKLDSGKEQPMKDRHGACECIAAFVATRLNDWRFA